jgi:hypothetical protein
MDNSASPKPIGFKFIIPNGFPIEPPYAYLDEPFNQQVVDMVDYLDQNMMI